MHRKEWKILKCDLRDYFNKKLQRLKNKLSNYIRDNDKSSVLMLLNLFERVEVVLLN